MTTKQQLPLKLTVHYFDLKIRTEWVSELSVLRPHQHSISYTGDGSYRSKKPNQQYQSTEERSTKDKEKNENN